MSSELDQLLVNPRALWLLLLLPALVLFLSARARARRRALTRFADAGLLCRMGLALAEPWPRLRGVLLLVAVTASIAALARPQWGSSQETSTRRGIDILIAVDVSDSMNAEDVEIGGRLSRLERARREVTDLLSRREGDRVGLIAFSGSSVLACPLTHDRGALALFVDTLDTDFASTDGTNLGAAIRTAIATFERTPRSSRALVLLTDGEDHEGQGLAAAREAREAGIRIFVLGIGRPEGAPLMGPDGALRRDANGDPVLSRLDEAALRRIAESTGGLYVRSTAGDDDLVEIDERGMRATLEERTLESRRHDQRAERFQWCVALALLALMLEVPLGIRTVRPETADA